MQNNIQPQQYCEENYLNETQNNTIPAVKPPQGYHKIFKMKDKITFRPNNNTVRNNDHNKIQPMAQQYCEKTI